MLFRYNTIHNSFGDQPEHILCNEEIEATSLSQKVLSKDYLVSTELHIKGQCTVCWLLSAAFLRFYREKLLILSFGHTIFLHIIDFFQYQRNLRSSTYVINAKINCYRCRQQTKMSNNLNAFCAVWYLVAHPLLYEYMS